MKKRIKVKPFRHKWGAAAYLGLFASWIERQELEVGLNLGPAILGVRFKWGRFLFDETETTRKPEFEWGTNFVCAGGTYRYARAGEDLKKGTIVEADLAGRIAPAPEHDTVEITSELIWGNVKACKDIDRHGTNVLGWPEVNVKEGWYCWLKQPPPGSEFEKEEG